MSAEPVLVCRVVRVLRAAGAHGSVLLVRKLALEHTADPEEEAEDEHEDETAAAGQHLVLHDEHGVLPSRSPLWRHRVCVRAAPGAGGPTTLRETGPAPLLLSSDGAVDGDGYSLKVSVSDGTIFVLDPGDELGGP